MDLNSNFLNFYSTITITRKIDAKMFFTEIILKLMKKNGVKGN